MRSYLSVILCSAFLLVLFEEGYGHRQKRFLRTDFLNPFTDSLVGLGEYAPDLSDQLSSQASVAVQHVMPQATSAMTRLTPWGHKVRDEMEGSELRPKKNLIRVPVGREMKADEKEGEVFNTEDVQQPQNKQSFGSGGNGFYAFIPFSLSFRLPNSWLEGENVCVERNEVEENEQESQNFTGFSTNFETTRCVPSESSYVCTKKIQTNGMRKTIVVRRHCCHGFVRRTDGRPGCSALKMKNLVETIKSLEMTKFLSWIENANLEERLQTENLTVFTPANEAVIDFEDDTEDNEITAINPAKLSDISPIVAGHIVEGFVNIDATENEQLIDTFDGQRKIRINKYQPTNDLVTANCIPISGKNNLATNGIVHLTSRVLPQPNVSLAEILENNKEYSRFKELLERNDLLDDLRRDDQPWTVFVPTNEAFEKLHPIYKKKFDSGEECIQNILPQHIVKGTICTAAIVSQKKVKNILENHLQLTRDEEEKLRVDGALMQSDDIMGTNGVIHEIDEVLIPPQSRNLPRTLGQLGRLDIINFIEIANYFNESQEIKGVTIFFPTKEAIKNLPEETKLELMKDSDYVRSIMKYHIVQTQMPSEKFMDNKRLTTLNGNTLHLKLHELFPGIFTAATVQCAYVIGHEFQGCGFVIHTINKVFFPPKENIVGVLKDMEGHSIVLKLLKNTDLETKLKEDGPFTFLAPTDDAFERMTETSLDDMSENKTLAEEILKLHVLPEVLCCNGVTHASPFHRQYVRTFDGNILPLHRGLGDRVRFGRARALECDISATNGLLHSINRVIQPQKPRSNIFSMDLWPFF